VPFQFDDEYSIIKNFNIRNIYRPDLIWEFTPSRFITYLTVALNYHFHGLNVFDYHLFNSVVHLVSAIMVWWLTLLTLSSPAIKDHKTAQSASLIATFVGVVFIAHPIQTEGVTYIIQRAASLATLFYVASLSLYVKSRLLEESGNEVRERHFYYYIASLITAFLAMFTKEIAITLPLMVLLYEFYFFRMRKQNNWKCYMFVILILPIIPLTMLTTASLKFSGMRMVAPAISNVSAWRYLLTQFQVIITYLRLLFMPLNQNLDYDYPLATHLFEFHTLSSFFILALIFIMAIRSFRKYRLISFGIIWFFLTLLPESSIIPIKDVIFEHRLYLPMVGFSLFLVSTLYVFLAGKTLRPLAITLFILVTIYSVLTYRRNMVWKDSFTLWNDAVHKSPNKSRPYNSRGLEYSNRGNFDQALSDYNKAIQLNPNYAYAYNNRGNTRNTKGDFNQAISDYTKAIEINPNFAEAYNNRGVAYGSKGYFDKEISDYTKAIEINPNFTEAYYNRGVVYYSKGSFDQAISDYTKAIQLNPRYTDAYNNRGNTYNTKGDFSQAISDYTKAIEIDPNFAEAYYNRGTAYGIKGNFDQAIADYTKAIQLNPNFAKAYNKRGLAYYRKGNFDQALSDYNKALEIDSKYAETYNNRGVVYFLDKDYDKAWQDVNKAEELGYKIHPEFLEQLKTASGREK